MIAHALFNSDPLDPDKMYADYADASAKIARSSATPRRC